MMAVSTQATLPLNYCSNFGDGVSATYSGCLNNNFSRIARELGNSSTPYCFAVGSRVSSFVNCVNSAFLSLQRASEGYVYTSYCLNFTEDTIDSSFKSCVQQNFNSFSRSL
jgi:hypothetical protein